MSIPLSQIKLPTNSPKVSIIITNFEKEKYLKNAISSCLNQTYKNIEVLIVNDSSDTKKSFKIARKFNNNKIKYFYTTRNYGHYACCNFAMDKSTGQYITFLGADDIIDPNHIENLLKVIYTNQCIMAHSLYNRYDEEGKLLGENMVCEASILFNKKQVLKDIGYFHMIRAGADTNFSHRMLNYYTRKYICSFQQVSYRALHNDSCLTTKSDLKDIRKKYHQDTLDFLNNNHKSKFYYNYKKDDYHFPVPDSIKVKNFNIKTFKEKKIT
jgi:glycosyltransferase involved in cell wall biosynthesis